MRHKLLILILICLMIAPMSSAQIVATAPEKVLDLDSVKRDFRNQPYFGLYKDNYFIFGPPIGFKPTRENTNVKFQISVAQRLTKDVLPFDSYLYLFYTQKCFWNVLEKSFPMTDLNFNPGIGIAKALYVKDRFIGKLSLIIEHESNGRDSIWSRSWNRISAAANILIDKNIMIHGKFWIPWVDGENNKDLLKYVGIYQFGLSYMSDNKRFETSLIMAKRKGWNFNFNTIIELAYKIRSTDNEYLFMQYYNGYGEGLLDYNKFVSNLRVGIVIKPKFFSDY